MKVLRISAIWCSACLVMKKVYQKIFTEYPFFEVIDYDYDLDEDTIKKYKIGNTIPVLIFLDEDGQEIDRIVGEKDYNYIKEFIQKKVVR